ncbi:leucine-rich repeat domain-containing protein [Hominibacterium faecale]|uniref:leucine-rich repeat domain-containing protein n=1 Tax=Hominibacterium faecale TaxID=2839743 RepID=UPI0022B2AAC1|nr:leucine-rich repeat domain-containing protein [Hominibacterium faecale]
MKKTFRLLTFLFILLITLFVSASIVSAHTENVQATDVKYKAEGGYLYFNKETGTVSGADETVIKASIPEEIAGHKVTTIGAGCFNGCLSLKTISFPASVQLIEPSVFVSCPSLESIHVDPSNAVYETIDNVLYNAKEKKLIRYPENKPGTGYQISEGTEIIGKYAFRDCYSLENVKIPNSVLYLEAFSFQGCNSIGEIKIPEGVKQIESGNFANCINLERVILPKSLENLQASNFVYCPKLKAIDVSDENQQYCDMNGVLFSKDLSRLYCYPAGKPQTFYLIPQTVKVVEYSAFNSSRNLRHIDMSDAVEKIFAGAFNQCTGLEIIRLSDGLSTMHQAFMDCKKLKSITIPPKLEKLDGWMFTGCENLESVYLPENIQIEDDYAFEYCDKVRLYGAMGSPAEAYAKRNGLPFFDISQIQYRKLSVSASTFRYNGRDQRPKISVEGLSEGKDYSLIKPDNSVRAGSYTVEIKGMGDYTGSRTVTYQIMPAPISNVQITGLMTKYTYKGKAITPSPRIFAGGKELRNGSDYTVSYSKGRKNVGIYTLKLAFRGDYSGSLSKQYTIVPKKTNLSKLTAGKKQLRVKWKRQRTQVTGYQIQYATNKKFTKKSVKTTTVKSNKTTSKKIKKLKAKKKYYVRIRTYKTIKISGHTKRIYSQWSKVNVKKTR